MPRGWCTGAARGAGWRPALQGFVLLLQVVFASRPLATGVHEGCVCVQFVGCGSPCGSRCQVRQCAQSTKQAVLLPTSWRCVLNTRALFDSYHKVVVLNRGCSALVKHDWQAKFNWKTLCVVAGCVATTAMPHGLAGRLAGPIAHQKADVIQCLVGAAWHLEWG